MMKKKSTVLTILLLLFISAGSWADTGLSRYLAGEPLIYIETDDFGSLLQKIRSSSAYGKFLKSTVMTDFQNSKLSLKLADRIAGLEENTGFALDIDKLANLAGKETALALYDIGELRMVYITRLGKEKIMQSSLWPLREQFETRKLGIIEYFVKEDPYGRASMAFIIIGDMLMISSDVLIFEESISLFSKSESASAESAKLESARQSWNANSDIRLFIDQGAVNKTPHFKSYWIYENLSDFENIDYSVASLQFSEKKVIEDRKIHYRDSEETNTAVWSVSLDSFSPVLLNLETVSSEASLKFWINQTFPVMTSQERTELSAAFREAGVSGKATIVERSSSGPAATHIFQLDSPEGFKSEDFARIIAEHYAGKVLPSFSTAPGFKADGDYQVLDLPLLEELAPAFKISGNALHYQPKRYLPASYIAQIKVGAENSNMYSAIDMDLYRTMLNSEIEGLKNLNAWSYSDGQEIFRENVPSLLEQMSIVRWAEKRSAVSKNLQTQQLVYHLR
jgi:hypothetical protein